VQFARYLNTNPIALLGHDQAQPIANCISITQVGNSLVALFQFPKEGVSQKSDETLALIQAAIIRAVSIGFMSIVAKPLPSGGLHFLSVELLEISFVAIPANPDALISEKAFKGTSPMTTYAQTRDAAYDGSAIVGGLARLVLTDLAGEKSNRIEDAARIYGGERHPAVQAYAKALVAGIGSSGAFIIPDEFSDSMIPLLYPRVVVRKAGATVLPMPHANMTLPSISYGALSYWAEEHVPINVGQPAFGVIHSAYRKFVSLTPISADILRYALPQFDQQLATHLAASVASLEDIAFLRSDGSASAPRGLYSFCNGTGNTVASTYAYNVTTIISELTACANLLLAQKIPMLNPGWVMNGATRLFLQTLANTNGIYPFAHELSKGKLLGYPVYETTAIPVNLTISGNTNCSEIYLCDFSEAIILETTSLEISLSRMGGTWTDSAGTHNAFQEDVRLLRAVGGRDFVLQHINAAAMIFGVAYHL
jgi:HK97 family phage major capsid protein